MAGIPQGCMDFFGDGNGGVATLNHRLMDRIPQGCYGGVRGEAGVGDFFGLVARSRLAHEAER